VPDLIPAASNELAVAVVSKLPAACAATNVELRASAVVDGVNVPVPVVPANEYNQAFAWNHLVPARAFVVHSLPPPKPKRKAEKPRKNERPNAGNPRKNERPKDGKKPKPAAGK